MYQELLTLFFLAIGIYLVYIGYMASEKICPPGKIEYRFVPRTFKEEQENPAKVSDIFADMFSKDVPLLA